ncbi:hypothetical protein TRVL_03666 [Trypanosoma vivax]|nr:hypothetical protein TRVL_03666 [Trypanosoma vivax]
MSAQSGAPSSALRCLPAVSPYQFSASPLTWASNHYRSRQNLAKRPPSVFSSSLARLPRSGSPCLFFVRRCCVKPRAFSSFFVSSSDNFSPRPSSVFRALPPVPTAAPAKPSPLCPCSVPVVVTSPKRPVASRMR